MKAAMPLLQQHGDNIVVNEEACKYLNQIKENLVIISCTGLYRTGKSFLLNSLAQVKKPVFNVGNTTDACTKGIWMYDTKKTLENGGRLIYFDSEGLASLDQDENYDAKIFSLSLLLSSYFILNTMGVIDESAIDRLFLVSELSKRIIIEKDHQEEEKMKSEDGGKEEIRQPEDMERLSRYFPKIMFCLRDFVLSLEHNGQPITPNVYLENALELRKGNGRRVDERNDTRQAIRELFRDRSCFTLIRPCNDENKMRQGLSLSSDLRPDFVQALNKLRQMIVNNAPLKNVNGTTLNGAMLVSLTKAYTNAMNSNVIPEIKSAWNQCLTEVCLQSYEDAFSKFKNILKKQVTISNVSSIRQYKKMITTFKNETLDEFNLSVRSASGKQQVTTYLKKLIESIDEYQETFLNELITKSREQCQKIALNSWKQSITKNIHSQLANRNNNNNNDNNKGKNEPKESMIEYDYIMNQYITFLSTYESEAKQISSDVVLIEFLKKIIIEDVGKKFEKNNHIATLVKNNLQAIVRRKESDVNNLKQSVEREIKRGKEQQETTKKAIEVLERRLLNAEEQKKVVNQLHKEEVKKREEALKLRRDTQRLLSDEKNKLRKTEKEVFACKKEIDDLKMKFVHYKRDVDSVIKTKSEENEVALILNEIVEQVVLKRFAEKSNLTLKKVKDELSRSLDERSAMSVKLQELMVKISTLPEIYQRVLFSADGNGDFYDQVADDESSIFSSWF